MMAKNQVEYSHRIFLCRVRHVFSFALLCCWLLSNLINSSPVPLLKIHTRGLGSLYKTVMFRREFCKSLGALFSLTKPSSTLLCNAQGTKTCKMALVTIPGMEVHGVRNIKGQIQVMWCSRWRLYQSYLCNLKFTRLPFVFLSWL